MNVHVNRSYFLVPRTTEAKEEKMAYGLLFLLYIMDIKNDSLAMSAFCFDSNIIF